MSIWKKEWVNIFFSCTSVSQKNAFQSNCSLYIWGLQPHTVMSAKKRTVMLQEIIGTHANMQTLDSIGKSALTAAALIFFLKPQSRAKWDTFMCRVYIVLLPSFTDFIWTLPQPRCIRLHIRAHTQEQTAFVGHKQWAVTHDGKGEKKCICMSN